MGMGLARGLAGAVVAVVVGGVGVASAQQYDLVVRGGRIVDGTGSPWYSGSVAIRDGKIVAILPAGVEVRTEAGPLQDDKAKGQAKEPAAGAGGVAGFSAAEARGASSGRNDSALEGAEEGGRAGARYSTLSMKPKEWAPGCGRNVRAAWVTGLLRGPSLRSG